MIILITFSLRDMKNETFPISLSCLNKPVVSITLRSVALLIHLVLITYWCAIKRFRLFSMFNCHCVLWKYKIQQFLLSHMSVTEWCFSSHRKGSLTDISQMYNLVVHGVCVIWVNIYMRHSDPAKITFLSTDSFISRNAVILWGLSPQKGPCRKGWPVISVAHTQQLHYSHNKCSEFHWLQWKHCVVAAASCSFHMYVERAT